MTLHEDIARHEAALVEAQAGASAARLQAQALQVVDRFSAGLADYWTRLWLRHASNANTVSVHLQRLAEAGQ